MKRTDDELDWPMTALSVAPQPDMRKAILSGLCTATVRIGLRNYKVGQSLMLCCELEPFCVRTSVERVRHVKAKQLKPEDLQRCGYETVRDMLDALRQFYPKVNRDTEVTFIGWHPVVGKLVDTAIRHVGA